MKNFIRAEAYYLKLDPIFRMITMMTVVVASLLAIFIGRMDQFQISTVLYPLDTVKSMSIFLFFLFPVYFCFFSTEGFESGAIKILASTSISKGKYIVTKILFTILIIVIWMVLFMVTFSLVYLLGSIITSRLNLSSDFLSIRFEELLSWFSITILIVSVACLICSLGLIVKKLASAAFVTFFVVMIDFMFNGYFKDSSSKVISFLAEHTFSASIMKASGSYLVGEKLVKVENHFLLLFVSVTIIMISIGMSLVYYSIADID